MNRILLLTGFSLAVAARLNALPETEAAAGRALTQRYASAIVQVRVNASLALSIGGVAAPPREIRLETNGTVISPDGLTAVSLIEIDPQLTAAAVARNLTMPGSGQVKVGETTLKNLRLRLADGTEVPARMVMQDAQRDLALIAPLPEPAPPPAAGAATAPMARRVFTWVNCGQAADPQPLSDYFVISRAPASLGRVPEIHAATIEGVVEEPQRLYIPTGFVTGCPMLDPQGHLLGLCLTQMQDGHPVMAGGHPSGVIVPAADLAAAAERSAGDKVASRR